MIIFSVRAVEVITADGTQYAFSDIDIMLAPFLEYR